MKYWSIYQHKYRVQDGYNYVNNQPHGFKMKPLYCVTLEFESKKEAYNFYNSLEVPLIELEDDREEIDKHH